MTPDVIQLILPFLVAFVCHSILAMFTGLYYRVVGQDYKFKYPCIALVIILYCSLYLVMQQAITPLVLAFYMQQYIDVLTGVMND